MIGLVFHRLFLPAPLDAVVLDRLLRRLAQPDAPRPMVLETHAGDDGVRYLVGVDPERASYALRILRQHLTGLRTLRADHRKVPPTAGRLRLRPLGLPLQTAVSEQAGFNIYGAFAARRPGERLALQVVLGQGHRPALVRPSASDPTVGFWSALVGGVRPASAEVRSRLRVRSEQPTISTTVRLAVSAPTADRRRALILELLGALRTLQAPDVRIDLVRQRRASFASGQLSGAIQLSPDELTPLLGWPFSSDLPGMPGPHPRRLSAPSGLSERDSVFAVSAMPGDDREIGIRPEGRLQHLVLTGPTGSGKSQVLARLILDDVAHSRPCVLVDPKRQLVDFVLDRIPADRIDDVVVLDAADESPVGFNPLDTAGRNVDVVVDGILAALQAIFADGWGPRTEDLLHAGLLTLARSGEVKREPHTLLDLPRLLTDPGFRRTVVGGLTRDPALASFWAGYEELSPSARAAIIAAPMNKLRKYVLRRNLTAVLGQPHPGFRLRDVFRSGRTVLVPLNDALLGPGAAQLLGSLVVAELWMATLERAGETDPTDRPGAIYIDEVQQFLHLPTSIADALATSRSYGVSWTLAHQFRSQLSPSMRTAFDANARNRIAFNAPADDARDLARMAPGLEPDDFMALPPYEVYARVVDKGAPTGWFSARTLPPAATSNTRDVVLAASREHYGRRAAVDEPDPKSSDAANLTSQPHQKARRS